MLWTVVAGFGGWVIFDLPKPAAISWFIPVVVGVMAMILWGILHLLAAAFWIATRPNPETTP